MPNISKIKINDNLYDIRDKEAQRKIYTQDTIPENAQVGDFWLDTDEQAAVSGSSAGGSASIEVTANVSELLPSTTFTPYYDSSLGCYIYGNYGELNATGGLELGQKYTVIFDETKYNCIAKLTTVPSFGDYIYIGNSLFVGEDTGEPFAFVSSINNNVVWDNVGFMGFDGNSHTASIAIVDSLIGKTIVIEEVDANDKPTKWKAVEYQEKICGTEMDYIYPEKTITSEESEQIVDFLLIEDNQYIVNFNGVDYNCKAKYFSTDEGSLCYLGNDLLIGGDDSGEPFAIATTVFEGIQVGIFAPLDESIESFTVSIKGEVPTKIPIEFIPTLEEMLSGNVILSETMVEIDPTERSGLINAAISLEVGKVYTVKYNGVEYSDCECLEYKESGSAILVLGNIGVMDNSYPETQHPFIIGGIPQPIGDDGINYQWVIVVLDSSDSVLLSISEISKIPIELLPEGMGGSSLPEVSNDDNGAFLRVVDGVWAVATLPNAEEGEF